MPNRILREDILTSERVNSLKGDEELFFRRLMSVVDDYGRIEVHSKILLTRCYPLQMDRVIESQIRQWLVILEDRKLVTIYEVSGKRYLEMYNFGQRKRHSKYPDPPKSQQLADRSPGNDTSGHEAGLETTQAGLEAEGARLQLSSHSPSTSPSNVGFKGECEGEDLAIVETGPSPQEIVEELRPIYLRAGVPIPPKHENLAIQYLCSIPPANRHRVADYVKHSLLSGKWRDELTTKGLLNLLRDGDWDVPIVARTLPAPPGREKVSAADSNRNRAVEQLKSEGVR